MYNLFLKNLKILLNDYNLNYYWVNLNEEQLFEGVKNTYSFEWENQKHNYWLQKYKNNKLELGKDIIQKQGMYTPFFYHLKDNKKCVVIGKHRLYSLLLNNSIKKIDNSFLFIEFPLMDTYIFNSSPLYKFNRQKNISEEFYPKTGIELYDFLIQFVDILGGYLSTNPDNIIPPKYFLNETEFNKWLKGETYE